MITPAYALTSTERVLPRLALDFTTGALDPRVTVTRALNTATRVNNSGFIEAVNADLPRFDYTPITLQPMGLLIEETRQNLLLQSENFNVSPWTKVTCSVSSDAIAGPDNTLSADKLIPDNGVTISATTVRQDITKAASALTYTISVFGKSAEYDRLRIRCQDSGGATNRADVVVNISTGAIVTAAAVAGTFTNPSAKVTAYGNGFFRIQLTFTTGTDTFLRIQLVPLDSTATTGDGVKGIYLYGSQLEAGAFATSYIPTTTTSLTRNADAVSMTGTNFSDWYNATEGTFTVQYSVPAIGPFILSAVNAASPTTENMYLRYSGGQHQAVVNTGGAVVTNIYDGTGLNTISNVKTSFAYKNNAYGIRTNGGASAAAIANSSSGALPSGINKLCIGSNTQGKGSFLNSPMAKLYYYNISLLNAELSATSK